jgi:hypothetical protein
VRVLRDISPRGGVEGCREKPELPLGADSEFKDLNPDLSLGTWVPSVYVQWEFKEEQVQRESRASVLSVWRQLRGKRYHCVRSVLLGNAMATVLAKDKGRSSKPVERQACRRTCAWEFAAGADLRFRWLPSEWDAADGLSRGSRKAASLGPELPTLRTPQAPKAQRRPAAEAL